MASALELWNVIPPPPDGAPFTIDLDVFWGQVARFKEWDYQLYEPPTNVAHKHPYTEVSPGYPAEVLERAKALGYGFPIKPGTRSDADATFPKDPLQRRYSNCCMFVEGVMIGAANAMPWVEERGPDGSPKFRFDIKKHNTYMVAYDFKSPPLPYTNPCYVWIDAGLATHVDHLKTEHLEPRTIYIAQIDGHAFFIVDYDPKTKRFLTLECNLGKAYARDLATWYGGVGFRGLGRMERFGAGWPEVDWSSDTLPVWKPGEKVPRLGKTIIGLVKVNIARPGGVHLPFDPPRGRGSVARYYHLAEAGSDGGYFPLGTQRNLHGGVHLPLDPRDQDRDGQVSAAEAQGTTPAAAPQPVRALAPGEVVAARLGRPRPGSSNELSLDLTGNHNGFVLLRHRLRLGKADDAAAPVRVVYSLYMHLAPLGEDPARDAKLPWLERLRRERHGAAFEVDPDAAGFRARRWLLDPAAAAGDPVRAAGDDGAEVALRRATAAGRVAVVRRAASTDVAEALTALEDDGQVATFAAPYLRVEAGELLGHVAAAPGRDPAAPGFLHWEVLAPVGPGEGGEASDLQAVLRHAEQALGAGCAFSLLEETSPNNLLDAGSGELQALLGLLPDADARSLLPDAYAPQDLRALLGGDAPRLAFALPVDPARPPGTLDVPLEVENYRHDGAPTVKPGTTVTLEVETDAGPERASVTLTFDEAKATGTVRVPAAARVLRIGLPQGVHLDASPAPPSPEERRRREVDLFERLTGVRWRRVLLRRPNEWTAAGLQGTVAARFPGVPAERLAPLVEATAWWAHAENPIVGAEGAETSLFDGGPGRLPAEGKLDSAHPVTFAWLVELLLARGLAAFVPPGEVALGADAGRPVQAGWLPAEPGAAPGPVRRRWAAAVADGDVTAGPPVTLRARGPGGRTVTLGQAPWAAGFAALALPFPLWGEWTLEVEGPPDRQPGPLEGLPDRTLSARRPVLAAAAGAGGPPEVPGPVWVPAAPPQAKASEAKAVPGRFEWTLEFAQDRPEWLGGWVLLETQRRPALAAAGAAGTAGAAGEPPADAWAPARLAIPLELTPPPGAPSPLKREGDLYVGGPADAKVTRSFTWGEWTKAAGGGACRVSARLAAAVQALRDRTGATPIKLEALDPGGLSVAATGPAAVLEAAAPGQVTPTDAAGIGRVVLTVPPAEPGGPGGPLVGSFAPQEAFARLLELHGVAPGEQLLVRFVALFTSGPAGDGTPEQDWARVAAEAGADRLEARAAGWRALVRPQLGPVRAALVGEALELRATLSEVDPAFWKAAAPCFEVEGGPKAVRVGGPDRLGQEVVGVLPLAEHAGRTLRLRAVATAAATREGLPVTIPDGPTLEYRVVAEVREAAARVEDGALAVTARLHAWPARKDVRVRLLDAAGAPAAPQPPVTFRKGGEAPGTGACEADGAFACAVRPPGPGAWVVEVGRPEGGKVWGAVPAPWRSPPLTVEAPAVEVEAAPLAVGGGP